MAGRSRVPARTAEPRRRHETHVGRGARSVLCMDRHRPGADDDGPCRLDRRRCAPRRADTVFHTQRTRDITATLHWLNARRRTCGCSWPGAPAAGGGCRWRGRSAVRTPSTWCCARPGPAATGCGCARPAVSRRFAWCSTAGAVPRPPVVRPFLTLLFSRSEIMGASDCRPDRTGSVNLVTQVAPELARRGIAGTGSVETGITQDAARACVHYKRSLTASWADLARLRDRYGWKFVSHGRTFATNLASLTPQAAVVGDLRQPARSRAPRALERRRAVRLPGQQVEHAKVETDVVSTCFAFGRRYAGGPTTRSEAMASPHWQRTTGIGGGRCNDRSAALLEAEDRRRPTARRSRSSSTLQPARQPTSG